VKQSEAEVDFIAATYGREWPQSELEVIVFEMEKYLAEYFAYASVPRVRYVLYTMACHRY